MVQFKSLKGPIPKIIRFANCSIRVKHTGQKVDEEKTNNNEQAEKNEQQTEQNKQQAEKNEQSADKNEQQIQADQQRPPPLPPKLIGKLVNNHPKRTGMPINKLTKSKKPKQKQSKIKTQKKMRIINKSKKYTQKKKKTVNAHQNQHLNPLPQNR